MSQTSLNDPVKLELLAGSVLGDLSEEEFEQVASILGRDDQVAEILEARARRLLEHPPGAGPARPPPA